MADYGSIAGIAAYVKHMTNTDGDFDADTLPPLATVTTFLDEVCAQLNGWIAAAGYVAPVTAAAAVPVLSRYANIGAAGLCELTMRSAGYSKDDKNKRENKFLDEFYKAEKFIVSGALAGLGATTTDEPAALSGFSVGGLTVGGQRLRPIFRRTSFGNDPTAESSPVREPDYSGGI